MKILFTGIVILFIAGCTTTMDHKNKLEVSGKKIDLEKSKLLFEEDFSSGKNLLNNWIEVGDAVWTVKDSALEGRWKDGNKLKHGQIFSKNTFQGDILMEFDAQTVAPSDHDIIWWWGVTLNKEKDKWKSGYLGALGGWWANQAGVEKIDGKEVYMAKTSLFKLELGKKYKIQCGIVDGTVFLFANGQLIIEFFDPMPLNSGTTYIGFGLYQSHVRFGNLKVSIPKWEKVKTSY